ncbi:glycosyltransferase [Ferruginibacter paludis]|uniref:glycosyltransferase n=1 Tax=Ferruginibacter paludis TaxID=1310417 RepID=UPI0025B4A301|nr:glycosyltransferase [Ferruginibacter paludis]MDN3654402.1 glycosyltransferase [Ferruginibacter paludis]
MICPTNLIDLCIIIPCYNNLEGLRTSLNSIHYNRGKYVIIIVDDGSIDAVTIEKLHCPQHDIKIITNSKNQGITIALNRALEFIYANYATRFIARLDCGDICSPNRFYTQIAFFDKHPEIHLTGSWCYFKDNTSGSAYSYCTPTLHKHIKREMYFRNVFIHPTVMWRMAGVGKLKYPEQYPCAEDYGLFYAMTDHAKTAIIDEFLVTCEINHKGISILQRSVQLKSRRKVVSFYGKNKFLAMLGSVKLFILMMIPYQIIFITKRVIYNAT